jgi:hypothetical protein
MKKPGRKKGSKVKGSQGPSRKDKCAGPGRFAHQFFSFGRFASSPPLRALSPPICSPPSFSSVVGQSSVAFNWKGRMGILSP